LTDTVEWRWVDVGGEQHVVHFDELADALASGALPPFVLVWRTTWTEWRGASTVPELAPALGLDAQPGPKARSSAMVLAPPPPPMSRYAGLAAAPAATLFAPLRTESPSTVPPAPRLRPAAVRVPAPPPELPVPPEMPSGPIPIRDVMPTLAGEEPVRSTTLRPAGALPPPPRAIPQAKIPVFDEPEEHAGTVGTPHPWVETSATPLAPRPVPHLAIPMVGSIPGLPPPRPAPLPTAPQPAALAARARRRRPAPTSVGGLSRNTVARLTSAGLVLPGGLLLIAALLRPPRHRALAPAETLAPVGTQSMGPAVVVASAPAPARAPRAAGCRLSKPAERLAPSVFAPVPLLLASTPDGVHATVGLAASKDRAIGLTIDPSTLKATQTFERTLEGGAALNVVPLVRSGSLDFAVDVDDPTLAFARTLDGPSRFTVGVTEEGFSRRIGSATDVIWPGKSKNPTITTPRVASVPGVGHALAFRHGGQEGKVLVGWLRDDGTKLTELKAVGTDAALSGTPTISAGDRGVLIAFASKAAPDEGWRVELATAPLGGVPGRATVFAMPAGGPGGEAISPSAEGLPRGRFLMQWTEGSAGNRAVRVAVLSPELSVTGEAITLSAQDQNAGQGALWIHGSRALALYLVKSGVSHELWGASLECL